MGISELNSREFTCKISSWQTCVCPGWGAACLFWALGCHRRCGDLRSGLLCKILILKLNNTVMVFWVFFCFLHCRPTLSPWLLALSLFKCQSPLGVFFPISGACTGLWFNEVEVWCWNIFSVLCQVLTLGVQSVLCADMINKAASDVLCY